MKGLLVKDIRLLMKRKRYFGILILVFLMIGTMMEASFLLTYLPLIAVLLAVGTVNSDEENNGMSFLMTLPVKASDYVAEKYVLGLIFGGSVWIISILMLIFSSVVQNTSVSGNIFLSALSVIPIFSVLLAVALPVEIKFGPEKGRIVLFISYGALLLVYLMGGKALTTLNVDASGMFAKLANLPQAVVEFGMIPVAVAVLAISYMISLNAMKKKEF